MAANSEVTDLDMLRPPINRAMRILDRAFFKTSIPTSAARVFDPKHIKSCRDDLHHDILKLDRKQAVVSVRDPQGADAKALLLKPGIRSEGKPRLAKLCGIERMVN